MSELKNNFILVHDNNDNSPIVINEKYIIKIYYVDKNETLVCINNNNICDDDSIKSISINENPEKVYNQLTKSNYIKVHSIVDNSIIILSIKDIIAVYKDIDSYSKTVTNIELCDSTNYGVHESVETVIKLCKGENFNL